MRNAERGMRNKNPTSQRVIGMHSAFRIPNSLAPVAIARGHLTQKFKFIEAFAGSFRDGAQGIFGHVDRETSLFAQKFVEAAEERAAAGKHQTAIHQIRSEERRVGEEFNTA